MTDREFETLLKEKREDLKDMLAFWEWIHGFNTLLKWLAIIGIPFTVGVWGIIQIFKKDK